MVPVQTQYIDYQEQANHVLLNYNICYTSMTALHSKPSSTLARFTRVYQAPFLLYPPRMLNMSQPL